MAVRGPEERFHVLYLDRRNRLISDERMGVGTVDHVTVYPREVIKRALALNASALILVHNHPSGDPTPSEADLVITNVGRQPCCPVPSAKLAGGSSRKPGVARVEAGATGAIIFPGG